MFRLALLKGDTVDEINEQIYGRIVDKYDSIGEDQRQNI